MGNPRRRGDGREQGLGSSLMLLDHITSTNWRGQVLLTGLSMRCPLEERGEFLVVLKGEDSDGAPVVGFHGAFSASEALVGAVERMNNGTIKWRIDQYAQGKGAAGDS